MVHRAALARDSVGSPDQIMAVNVLGTGHALLARRLSAWAGRSCPPARRFRDRRGRAAARLLSGR
jgi:hypothetical protein